MKKDFKENRFCNIKELYNEKCEELLWRELFDYINFFKPIEIFNKQLLFMHRFPRKIAKKVAYQYNCKCIAYHPTFFTTVILFYEIK